MDLIWQIIAGILPAGVVFLTISLFLKKQEEKEIRNLKIELKKERQQYFLPNRLESYQRMIVLMERIHPNSLVMRIHNPGLPSSAFQAELLASIREEFDHNVAQQLFISPSAWNMVKNAKDETVKIINIAGNQTTPASTATDLASKIFEIVGEVGTLPTSIAADYLRNEFQELAG